MRSIGNFSLVIIFIDRLRRAFYQLFSTLLHECSIICSILNDQEARIFKIFRNIFLNHYHIFDLMITQSFNDNQQRSLYISRLKSLDCFNIDGSSLKMMMTKMMMNSGSEDLFLAIMTSLYDSSVRSVGFETGHPLWLDRNIN